MVIWIVIRYIIIADTSRSALRILSKAIIVIIRIIICDMVMTIWITIKYIILVRNSRIAIKIVIKVVIVIIIIVFVSVGVIFVIIIIANIPAGNYMFNVNNRNTRTRFEICSKLTIKIPERLILDSWFMKRNCSG